MQSIGPENIEDMLKTINFVGTLIWRQKKVEKKKATLGVEGGDS